MVGIQQIIQKKFLTKSLIFVSAVLFLFFLSTSFAYAGIDTWIHGIGIGVGGFVAGLGGLLLDSAIDHLVLQMGDLFINRGLGSVVTSIWTMIRDLFNILFIFSLVYIGLRTILDSDDSRTKKMLGMLIAAALLINFSLYIAKVIVDVANFSAIEIHKTATSGITGTFGLEGDIINYVSGISSLSGAYMQVLSVPSWFDTDVDTLTAAAGETANVFVYSVMALLFLMFLGFVLAYGAIMLAVRFIAIIFYLIFSPFMFLGWVLPQFQSYATQWWKGFLGYSFFAPVYIFMLYIGLYSLQQIKEGFGADASFGQVFGGGVKTVDTFSIFLLFIIGTGFLIAATKVAGAMSNGGAAIGMNMADKFSKKMSLGVGSRMASGAVGGVSSYVGDKMDARSAASGTAPGRTGRAVRSFVGSGTSAKFGGTTSRKDRTDADKKAYREHASAHAVHDTIQKVKAGDIAALKGASNQVLEKLAATKEGRTLLEANAQHLSKEQVKSITNSKEEGVTEDFKSSLAAKHKTTTEAALLSNLGGSATGPISDLRKASKEQLEAVGTARMSLPENAARLTKKQIDSLEELQNEGKLDRTEVAAVIAARETALTSIATGTPIAGGPSRGDLLKMGDGIPDLPQAVLVGLAADLSRAALRKIAQNADPVKQRAVRTAVERTRAPAQPPIDPGTGKMIESGDALWTDNHDIWEFLHRDNIGKDLGR